MEQENKTEVDDQGFVDTKKLIMEFLGTFALTYIGSWTIIYKDISEIQFMGVSLAHALTLTVFTWITLDVSGSHFNPAITLALIVNSKMEWSLGVFYILTQFLGALAGAGFIYIQMTESMANMVEEKSVLGIPKPGSPHYDVSGIWAELLGSFFMVYVYFALFVYRGKRSIDYYPLAMGMIVFVCMMTLGEVSGGAFNPARALGPAIMAGQVSDIQVNQLFGSMIGGILGSIFYRSIFVDEEGDLVNPDDLTKDDNDSVEAELIMTQSKKEEQDLSD